MAQKGRKINQVIENPSQKILHITQKIIFISGTSKFKLGHPIAIHRLEYHHHTA